MDHQTKEFIQNVGVHRLSALFHVDAKTLEVIQDSRNFVYQAKIASNTVIFKVLPSQTAQQDLLLGELDWMEHLACKGLSVPKPYVSCDGNLVEMIQVNGWFLSAYCLQKVEGELWCNAPEGAVDIYDIGQLAGFMHNYSQGYKPRFQTARRPCWSDAPWFLKPEDIIHPSMPKVITKAKELFRILSSLPQEEYDMIHDDLHGGNIIISGGKPVPIDFENCMYSWHAADIASALYFHLWKTPASAPLELSARARKFISRFLKGYRSANTISKSSILQIPLFLKIRDLSILANSNLAFKDFDNIGSRDSQFAFMKSNIENDVPYVELDFSTIDE